MPAKYRKLAAEIRDAITSGEYPAGYRLPTIAEIAAERSMGQATVAAAIQLLAAEGVVHAAPVTGIVVLDQRPVRITLNRYAEVLQPGGQLGPWETACQQAGIPGRMALIEVEPAVAAEADVASLLDLPIGKHRITRRSRHAMLGDPERVAQLQTASYPARLVKGTPLVRSEKITGGVYGALAAAGIHPATTAETVRARPASDDEAAELRIRGGTVLTIERVTRDAAGRPVELLQIVADPARTTLVYDPLPLPS